MQLTPLTNQSEATFWQIVKKDFCDYYFFIYDWLNHKEKTCIYLAQEGDEVAGLMLVYQGNIVQMRGSIEAVQFMLEQLDFSELDVQVPLNCESLLTTRFPCFSLKAHVTLMALNRGQELLCFKVTPQRLCAVDAQDIASLMNQSYPQMWSEVTAEMVASIMQFKESLMVGVKVGGKLVSFGYATLTPTVSHVTWIATHPSHENRGYATSIVSALIKECLEVAPTAIIYVMENNAVANRLYLKAGFKPQRTYAFIRQ
ncbi:MAG: GNAT family N-acetyltransferase [Candidatus Bathyarchaeota archaeon]|nr:GNAT family N-acetyltransferase [Candidatus Bathyarchaeota archaeon]